MTELTEYGSTETLTYIHGVNVVHELKVKKVNIKPGTSIPVAISEMEVDEITREKTYISKTQTQKHKHKSIKVILASTGKIMVTTDDNTYTLENSMEDCVILPDNWYRISNVGTWPATLILIEGGNMCVDIDIDTKEQ